MLNDLNKSYANYIEQQGYCSNPTSSECQNLYATYLIAKYLFYTYGETLGQSVTISGNHNEYALILFDYNGDDKYSVTLNDVLCMLEMMKYYNYVPLEVMYGNNVIASSSSNNMACYVLSQVLSKENPAEYSSLTGSQYSTKVYNKLLVNSYEVEKSDNTDQSGNTVELSSTSNNPEPNDVIIIPSMQPPDGIIIEYTYEGGNRVILLTSISGCRWKLIYKLQSF